MTNFQTTINSQVLLNGVGLHTGKNVTIKFLFRTIQQNTLLALIFLRSRLNFVFDAFFKPKDKI